MAILGLCDVLSTGSHASFADAFVPADARELPAKRFVDVPYPACRWIGSLGIDRERVGAWLGHRLGTRRGRR